ncbi:Periplasmic protein involved in polysaccharide export (fragment) [Desulfamplus magnetovallimortis]|uniref:Periplasmic protein involved in polysaccharide export n=1 Tax=Desulfamplus magnetovallimortis TaxID=1246637 RepID=A0A1W1HDT0_9BACT
MIRKTFLISFCYTIFAIFSPVLADTLPALEDYRIGTGDILDISVWKDPALTKQVIVLPDGKIHFPLVGEMVAEGRSVAELTSELEKKIVQYVPDPVLSVSVTQIGSMILYVIGKVNKPGHFLLNSRINVLQALSMAGGLNPFAKEKEIRIYRKDGDKTLQFMFNYRDVSEGENLDQNILLHRGDVIVVP